jgi:aminocarboxymuconate-semialdehyde decarboxylase
MKVIDFHAHIVPPIFVEKAGEAYGVYLMTKPDGSKYITFNNGDYHPYSPVFFDMEARKKELDKQKIDIQGLAIAPRLFYYDEPLPLALKAAQACNEAISEFVKSDPARFFGIGTVPLQDGGAAIVELRRIHDMYNFKSIQIGTDVAGKSIADPGLFPFWAEVEKLDMTVFLHPYFYGAQRFLGDYYLGNFIGNPLDTTIAAAHLIFGGVCEKHPKLRFVLSHGGGFLPYQIGRFDHGYIERAESKKYIDKLPSHYFKQNFYFDYILHDPLRTRALIDLVGIDKVLLGTDYPYDMADHDPLGTAQKLNLNEADYARLVEGNARKLFLRE